MQPRFPVAFARYFLSSSLCQMQVMMQCPPALLRQLYQRVQPWFMEQKPNEEDWAQVVYALARSGRAMPRYAKMAGARAGHGRTKK